MGRAVCTRSQATQSRQELGDGNSTALKNLAEYVAGEISSTNELELGQGAIIREGLKKIAVPRYQGGWSPALRSMYAPRLPSALE
jgi:hypothetical protein